MSHKVTGSLVAAVVSLAVVGGAAVASAQDGGSRVSASVMGGIHALNKNDTALPDGIINIPLVGTLTYGLSQNLAVEGELTWLVPVEQDVELGPGVTQKVKTPHVLAYQANVRAGLPLDGGLTPYAVAGAGALTFLSSTDANRLPQLAESQTMFAINFGAGATYDITSRLALRADFREFAAFPGDDVAGFSSGGTADPIWMERGTLGLAFRF